MGWTLRLNEGLFPAFFMGDGIHRLNLNGSAALTIGQWNHLAAVIDRDTTIATLYVNGEAVTSTSADTPLVFIGSVSSNTVIRLGNWNTLNGDYWMGELDEVRLWNTAISQTEINANMNLSLTGSENNLQAYYNFESGTAIDITGNGYDGTITGDVSSNHRGIATFTQGNGTLTGVLAGSPGGTFSLVAQPSLGSVIINSSTGAFTYTATDSSVTGTDRFSYYVTDSDGNQSDSETVNLTLEAP